MLLVNMQQKRRMSERKRVKMYTDYMASMSLCKIVTGRVHYANCRRRHQLACQRKRERRDTMILHSFPRTLGIDVLCMYVPYETYIYALYVYTYTLALHERKKRSLHV